ncbi:hypothetical protein IG631_20773 [Alternaria alternata]|nr:hypothetical protein IG631_20773 [Alternaria alternata]
MAALVLTFADTGRGVRCIPAAMHDPAGVQGCRGAAQLSQPVDTRAPAAPSRYGRTQDEAGILLDKAVHPCRIKNLKYQP